MAPPAPKLKRMSADHVSEEDSIDGSVERGPGAFGVRVPAARRPPLAREVGLTALRHISATLSLFLCGGSLRAFVMRVP